MSFKGNKSKVEHDIDLIIKRLKETPTTLTQLMREYHCGYACLMSAILSKISKGQYRQIALKKLRQAGTAGRFTKGHITWNKGKKVILPPACKATQFKKGILRGQAARNWRPIGTISIRLDRGYKTKKRRFIKVSNNGQPSKRWIPYARYVWQQIHGPIPDGFLVGHRDGKLMNDSPDNLILMDRRSNMLRLETIRPGSLAKCRKKAAKIIKQRWAVYRKLKNSGTVIIQWECPECGADYKTKPERCTKCGCLYLEKIKAKNHQPQFAAEN